VIKIVAIFHFKVEDCHEKYHDRFFKGIFLANRPIYFYIELTLK
jgi:hypothetical protein